MLLRSLPGRRALIGSALATTAALLPGSAAHAATATAATPASTAVAATSIVTTAPSSLIGGLPASSQDGKVEYLPETSASASTLKTSGQGLTAASAAPSASALSQGTTNPATTGYDISWPQCGGAMPANSSVAVVGVDDGHPFSRNPCLQQEAAWASTAEVRAQYMVVDSPIGWSSATVTEYADHGPAGSCTSTQLTCESYNWGYNAAYADVAYADSEGATSPQWWLDVELPESDSIDPTGANCYQANFWVCDPKSNSAVILGALTALRQQGKTAGVYSTQTQWQSITAGLPLGVPIWIAGYDYPAATYCATANAETYWFALGEPQLVQSLPATYDPDTACLGY